MTSITGSELEAGTDLSRRLAVLPAATGALAVVLVVVVGRLGGLTETSEGQALLAAATVLVAVAIVAGFVVGHYLGLAVLVLAAQLTVDPRSTAQLAVIVPGFIAIHEIGRFSLDARRPTRFGPGYVRRFFVRALVTAVVPVLLVVVAVRVDDVELPPILVPVGLALASIPLFTRRGVQAMAPARRGSAAVRLVAGMFVAVLALGGALVGAQARTGIANDRAQDVGPDSDQVVTDPQVRSVEDDRLTEEQSELARLVSFVVLGLAVLVAGLLVAAFRRPEVNFELDDLDHDVEHRSLQVTNPGETDLDDDVALIDERDAADLLDGLLLDISTEPDPGRAIRFGYATVERRLAELGVERRDSETEQELLSRALPVLVGGEEPMVRLTSLFESARFGFDAMTEAMREQALDAIRTLRAATPVPKAPSETSARHKGSLTDGHQGEDES